MIKMFIRNIFVNSYLTAVPIRQFFIESNLRRISCWKCGEEHSHCEQGSKCVATQDPSKINYFELLGQKISYNIDTTTLVSNYHKLQIQYHPDKHNNESEEEKRKSETFSVLVNKAYKTLVNPIERGLYLLELNGVSIDQEATSNKNPELLMLLISYNDEISRIISPIAAKKMRKKLEGEIERLTKIVRKAFDEEDYDFAKETMIRIKYHTNLIKNLNERIEKLNLDA